MNKRKKRITWSIIIIFLIIAANMETAAGTMLITGAGAAFLGHRAYRAHRLGLRLRRLIFGLLALMFIISLFGQLQTGGQPQIVVTEAQPQQQQEQPQQPQQEEKKERPEQEQTQAYYKNCKEVREAGAAPIHKGQAGYSTKLDRDGDGVACDR